MGVMSPRHSLANSSEVKAEHPAEEIVEDQPAIAKDYKLSQADGGSVRTDPGLGQRFIVNKDSSLRRVWVAVHDNLPLTIDGTPGVTTFYLRSEPYGYRYAASAILIVSPDQDVTACTMKFLLIDVFSERMTTLSARVIQDIGAGEKKHSIGSGAPAGKRAMSKDTSHRSPSSTRCGPLTGRFIKPTTPLSSTH